MKAAEQTLRERRTAKSFHADGLSKSPETTPPGSPPVTHRDNDNNTPATTTNGTTNNNNNQQYIESLQTKREGLITQIKEAEEMLKGKKKEKPTPQQKEFAQNMINQLQQELEELTKELKELKVETSKSPESTDWKKTTKDRQSKSKSFTKTLKSFTVRRKSHIVEATVSDDSDDEPITVTDIKDPKRATH